MTVLVAGIVVTLATTTLGFILGVALVTLGFFGAHSIASSWVGARASVLGGKGAALYLFFYYAGAAVLSTGGGLAWDVGGWPVVVAYASGIAAVALLAGLNLSRREGGASKSTAPPMGG